MVMPQQRRAPTARQSPQASAARVSVCHVLSSFGLGGMERVALDLAAGLEERGGRAIVVALGPEGPIARELRSAGIATHALERRRRGYDLGLVMRLRRLLRAERIDVVHTHNPHALLYGAVAGELAGCGVVHTKHGKNPSSAAELRFRRQVGRLVDCYVAVSNATAVVALEKRETDAARLRVIPNGIDLRRFAASSGERSRLRAALGVPDDAFVFGTVGRLVPEKDQATLIRAAAPLLGERCRLLLAGDGPEAPALRAVADGAPNGGFVHFLGARSDVPAVLAAMDAFVLSSETEGLPLALLEAMAAGLPILSTPVGGIAEVVQPDVSGRLFPVGDVGALRRELEALRSRPDEARRLGAEGRAFAHAIYSRDAAVDRYLTAYATAMDARRT